MHPSKGRKQVMLCRYGTHIRHCKLSGAKINAMPPNKKEMNLGVREFPNFRKPMRIEMVADQSNVGMGQELPKNQSKVESRRLYLLLILS